MLDDLFHEQPHPQSQSPSDITFHPVKLVRIEKRKAFIKKSFHKNVRNPLHYDMLLNTGFMSINDCTDMICQYLEHKYSLI